MAFHVQRALENSVIPKRSIRKSTVTRANSTKVWPSGRVNRCLKSGIRSHITHLNLWTKSHVQIDDSGNERIEWVAVHLNGDPVRWITHIKGRRPTTGRY